ncbi:DNA-directed RNA polymerase subunit [Elysia marginata]|uniref:DNA-directed RNA polymerase subunit n=1 Tax=Elysia marginata TaxID=1093978 RepID=A0AAV4GTV2_9GAST|nr:DNA-directed RNA polymerase subunit [Elysia marginata]
MASAPYSTIETLSFTIASDADNVRDSVVEVTSYELFAGDRPVSGGCFDPRMGTTDHHYGCVTCGLQRRECPGHGGLMHSRVSLESPLFVAEIRRWLRVICLECGAPVIDPRKYESVGRAQRLVEASKASTEGARCPLCTAVHPKIVKDDDDYFTYNAVYPSAGKAVVRKLYPGAIREMFERVTSATAEAFGRPYHPSVLVLRKIFVPPNTIRPGVRMGFGPTGAASYHDLTNMVQYLVKRNLMLPREMPPQITKDLDRLIQNAQQLYYDMVLGGAGTDAANGSSGKRGLVVGSRSVRSIVRTFARKEGRIRKNLLGKRVWLISRSTISGNPHLRIDEVGYPVAFARTIQVEETVQEFNRDRLMVYFLNGVKQYPGCTRVIKRATGAVHRVSGLRRDFQLEIGDRIERDVVTGDFGFFNRAPSLERSSIGVHRIVILEDPTIHTFQMNVAACDWYNADFDGDQMNLWTPHTIMSRVEAELMSSAPNWFISTKSSGPVNGQVQDSNVGSFELTRSASVMDKFHAMALFAATRSDPPDFSEASHEDRYTGRSVVSLLFERLPVNFDKPPRWYSETLAPYIDYDPQEIRTELKSGKLLSGVLDKNSVGAGAGGGIFHLISREYGARKALDAIYALQQMAISFIGNRGFTVGTGDMVVGSKGLAEIHDIVAGVLRESELITERLTHGELVPPIGMTTHEYYERLQQEALKVPDELLRPVLSSIDPDWNGLFKMVATGSKGSTPNLLHIMGLIGQIELNTQRIQEQFGFRRTNVYFPRFATGAAAYGFVKNCYVTGMTSPEYVFSDMNGRFDLINKALSTASTGYANRKAVMALQSDIVDNFRRLAKDTCIVQLLYGEDGLDTRRVERVKFRVVFLSDASLKAAFRLDLQAAGVQGGNAQAQAVFDKAFARIRADRDEYRRIFLRFEDSDFSDPLTDVRQMPVNVARLVRDVKIARESRGARRPSPDAQALIAMHEKVESFCAILPYVLINEIQERRRSAIPLHLSAATWLLQMLLRAELSAPVLCGFDPADLDYVLDAVRLHYSQALIDYGTAAGILAAQAVSEPLTQYMLDSHHRSVGGGTNKAGIIRPAEIFGAKPVEAEQSSEMLLRVKPEYESDRSEVLHIANQIELMSFERFVVVWDLLLEPFDSRIYPAFVADQKWLDEFARYHPLLPPPSDLSNWCARFQLDRAAMILKSMTLELIVERLRAKHPLAYVVHTPGNASEVVVRVYFRAAKFRRGPQDGDRVQEVVEKELLPTTIRGVPGIQAASVKEIKRHLVGPDGALTLNSVYAIQTVGTNIYGVLTNRRIDPLRIVSSSIGDTEKVFGVAAARNTIVREIRRFMGSKAPNVRHLLLYADEMARTGRVTPLEKGGVNLRERDNVFLRMAMSAPTQVVQDAATSGATGRVYGIAPHLMLGRAPPLGSTWNSFSMDESFVRENKKSVDTVLDGL